MWLGVVILAALLLVLHRRQRFSLLIGIASVVAAIASGGVWLLITRAAGMPRALLPTHQKDGGIHRLLASSEHEIFLTSERGLTIVDVPSLRIVRSLEWDKPGTYVPTSVAWSGRVLLLVWHDGKTGHYALASRDGWVVPPRNAPHDDVTVAGYWDRTAKSFVITSRANILGDNVAFRTRGFTFLDENGAELRTVESVTPMEMVTHAGFCVSGGEDVVATTGFSTCRTKSPITHESMWSCVDGKIGEIPDCPNHLSTLRRTSAWLGVSGVESSPALPAPLAELFPERAFEPLVLFRDDGNVAPRDEHYGKDHTTLFRTGAGYLRVRPINEAEALRRGHTPAEESILERYDDSGKLVAEGAVLRPPIFSRIVEMDDQVALVGDQLDAVARFDKQTMVRLDPPDTTTALHDRLERWGGASPAFRFFVVFGLAVGPFLPFLLLTLRISRKHPDGRLARLLPRATAILAILAAVALVMTLTRYYYL